MTSVEILNDGEKNWQFGPSLPSGIAAASAITDPLGSVYLIGGEGGGLSTKIYIPNKNFLQKCQTSVPIFFYTHIFSA